MYKSIAVIGLGTLGGFVAVNLSYLNFLEKLILVDFDVVTNKNLRNSVYSEKYIGKNKVDALKDIITSLNDKISITEINTRFLENVTKIPQVDLTIDCRDFVYDRGNSIDIRAYITARYLIIDGRKEIKYNINHEGKYTASLTKLDLITAASTISRYIQDGLIKDIIDKEMTYRVELDYSKKDLYNAVEKIEGRQDIVFDDKRGYDKLLNLVDNSESIINLNKQSDIVACIGGSTSPIIKRTIPRKSLTCFNDLVSNLTNMIDVPLSFNYYVVNISIGKEIYIELLPETGAA